MKRLLAIPFAFLLLVSCSKEEERVFRKSTVLMDTLVTITVVAEDGPRAEKAIDAAFAVLGTLEKKISFWDPESEISAVNRKAGRRPVKVSPATFNLIEEALYVSENTEGAFDATIGPVIRLWDFKKKRRPEPLDLQKKLALVGCRAMRLDKNGRTAFLSRKGVSFDTGGIAKGYGADLAEAELKRHGIKAGLVAIAGDIKAFGRKPGGEGWTVAVRDPRPPEGKDGLLATVELVDEGVSTSGDYERFFIEDGTRYHHLLDPRTGYPAHGFQSVSVIAPKAAHSDGFSTGLFVMGPEKAPAVAQKLGFGAIFVDGAGNVQITGNVKKRVKLERGQR